MVKVGGRKLRAIGVTSGIGSMLIGARTASFEIVGNIEWRKYYHTGTFEHNFPGAFMVHSFDEIEGGIGKIDLAIGHPECGNFSNLRTTSKVAPDDPGDIPVFTDLIQRIKPRYFVMDNLPGSLIAYPMSKWHSELPEYELYPEWVSNYHYGNTQKNRRRFFLVGALRGEKYVFVPGEFDHGKTLRDVIKDLPDYDLPDINHVHAPDDRIIPCGWAAHQLGIDREGNKVTLGELKDYIRDYQVGKNFEYLNLKGELKLRPGYCKIKLDHFAPVMTGGGSALDNHYREDTLNPLTIRERARIQGCPDDFIFQPIGYFDEKNLRQAYMAVYKQSGKFMPVEFCEYVCRQIAAHVNRRTWEATGKRIANPNPHVDEAKQWYCGNVGYENQDQACGACWLSTRCRVKGGTMVQVKTKEPVRRRQVPKEKTATGSVRMREGTGMSIKRIRKKGVPSVVGVQRVRCARGSVPPDYHCRCRYCEQVIGELRPADGSYYSRLERNQYYDPTERGKGQGHIAKTPLHIARWAVQRYSEEDDWVLDPTAGAGTTLVEALVQGRNAAGIELQYTEILEANVSRHAVGSRKAVLGFGDARNVGMMAEFLIENDSRPTLVVNNPPYFGDQSFPGPAKEGVGPEFRDKEMTYFYDKTLPNLAFLKEGDEYWSTMTEIYRTCVDVLLKGGHFVVGVKDQMRQKKPDGLHMKLADVLSSLGMKYVGTSFLKHHPPTLFLNTYEKIHGVPPVRYQTILVFKKG